MEDASGFTDRRSVIAAIGVALAAPAAAQEPAGKTSTEPRQAWGHLDGRFKLLANGAPQVIDDPMAYLRIQEAYARYGIAYDEGRSDVLSSLITDDAVVETALGSGKPFLTVTGRAAVLANWADVWRQQRDQRRHCFTNIVVERLTQTEATALAYGVITVAANGDLIVGAAAFYTSELRKGADGLWRFSRMFIGMDAYLGQKPKVGNG